jgi:hypothetical protein
MGVEAAIRLSGNSRSGYPHRICTRDLKDSVAIYLDTTFESSALRDPGRDIAMDDGEVMFGVGGGTCVHAAWLTGQGFRVQLVDVGPAHVRAALEHGHLTAEIGDAAGSPRRMCRSTQCC